MHRCVSEPGVPTLALGLMFGLFRTPPPSPPDAMRVSSSHMEHTGSRTTRTDGRRQPTYIEGAVGSKKLRRVWEGTGVKALLSLRWG